MNERLAAALADRYLIQRELGAGGMATVYLAQDLKHDRKVAIKVLKPELAAVIGADRFLAEIRTTANLQHPHILPLHDSGDARGFLFYVMPFVEGVTVRDRIAREHQLPVSEAVRIATEVASALDYAHRHGVIHRDIKPENILLHDGSALVADFGIALAVSTAGTRMTETGMSLGTPHYMSPEQAMGEREITARSDVYALGCVTYEMLVGEPPFTGPTAQAIIARVMTEEPRTLAQQRKSVPPHVEAAVLTAIEKLPGDRYGSTAEFAKALHDESSDERRVTRSGPGARRPLQRASLRPRLPLLAVLIVAIATIGILAFRRRSPTSDASPVSFAVEPPMADGDNPRFGDAAISPDGSVIAFVSGGAATSAIYLRHLADAEAHLVPQSTGGGTPIFSPDGKSLAFVAAGKWLRIQLSGGRVETIGGAPGFNVPGGTWTAAGDLIVTGSATGLGLQRIPSAGGVATPLTRTTDEHAAPVALPDGKHVSFIHWGPGYTEDDSLAIASLADGSWHTLGVLAVQPLGMIDGSLYYITADGSVMGAPFDLARGIFREKPAVVDHGIQAIGLGAGMAALSSSGTLVAQRGTPESRLALAGTDGSISPLTQVKYGYQGPQFSPNGRRIVFAVQRDLTDAIESDIWIMDEPGAIPRQLTTSGGFFGPVWMPDGKRIVYRSQYRRTPVIMMQPADGASDATTLFTGPTDGYILDVSLTPDGSGVVYTAQEPRRTNTTLFYLSFVPGSKPDRLFADDSGSFSQGRVSPDGRWLAYVAYADGNVHLMVRPFRSPGGAAEIAAGWDSHWTSPSAIMYVDNAGHLMRAGLALSNVGARVTGRTPIFPGTRLSEHPEQTFSPIYDLAPDGKLLFVRPTDDRSRLVVTTNWSKLIAQSRKQP